MTRTRLADRLTRLEAERQAALGREIDQTPLACLGGKTILEASPLERAILESWLEADLAGRFEGPGDREAMLAELARRGYQDETETLPQGDIYH